MTHNAVLEYAVNSAGWSALGFITSWLMCHRWQRHNRKGDR